MRSLRTRVTSTMLCVILVALSVVTLLSAIFTRVTESAKSERLLMMLCETGERSLDYYFDSVQNSVIKVTSYAEEDLKGLEADQLGDHVERMREYFGMAVSETKGVLTYYYRLDPSVSPEEKGFWYINLTGEGFEEHEVTDITRYDVEDTSRLVWFTVPKHEGKAIWLPPYITDNLDVRVISYDAPVYWNGQFIGVIGIEVDYSTMAGEVDAIRLSENGYAFLSDDEGNLFYHPNIDVTDVSSDETYKLPFSTNGTDHFVKYVYDGEKKEAVWLPLSNGMHLNVSVPVSETKGEWIGLILHIAMGAVVVLVVASLFLMFYTRRITRPLEELTEAAEQVEKGNYDFVLTYDEDDELGRLTSTFRNLAGTVRDHISDLNEQVFVDALTFLKNKGAYVKEIDVLQNMIDNGPEPPEFAIGVFDCDSLKAINDKYGHDKGDIYIKKAAHTISEVYKHSPVFRVGGDEFSVILKNEAYKEMDSLRELLDKTMDEINAVAQEPWEKVYISKGFSVYDPSADSSVTEVIQRADKLMYENKRDRKKHQRI